MSKKTPKRKSVGPKISVWEPDNENPGILRYKNAEINGSTISGVVFSKIDLVQLSENLTNVRSKSLENSIILVNPDTMKSLRWNLGDFVHFEGRVLKVWPSKTLEPACFGVSSFNTPEGDDVQISKLEKVTQADELWVEQISTPENGFQFSEKPHLCSSGLNGKVVFPNENVAVSLYGKEYSFVFSPVSLEFLKLEEEQVGLQITSKTKLIFNTGFIFKNWSEILF